MLNQWREKELLFISDGLTGLGEAVTDIFPRAKHQTCWRHLLRTIMNKLRVSDKKEILEDAKAMYKSETLEQANEALTAFVQKWTKKYPKVVSMFKAKTNLFTFYAFPSQIRASIYTNNLWENLNT